MRKAGLTGTRFGMSCRQKNALLELFKVYQPAEFHHGDCIGADADSCGILDLAQDTCDFSTWIVVHPPTDDSKRAFMGGHLIRDPEPYLVRDRAIVDETDYLIATPLTMYELDYGGTWYTVGYARELFRPIAIVWPDGTVKWENLAHNCRFEYCDAPQGRCRNPE